MINSRCKMLLYLLLRCFTPYVINYPSYRVENREISFLYYTFNYIVIQGITVKNSFSIEELLVVGVYVEIEVFLESLTLLTFTQY